MSEVIVQTVKKVYDSKIKAGIAYYTFISTINNIKLTPRELQLMAYINYRGTISSSSAREDFCGIFNSSKATVSNMTSKLVKMGLLIKDKFKTRVNPSIAIDFDKDLVVRLFLSAIEKEVEDGV